MSNVALADADVIRPKKTIARNMSTILSDLIESRLGAFVYPGGKPPRMS
jgi:hypothetical protein